MTCNPELVAREISRSALVPTSEAEGPLRRLIDWVLESDEIAVEAWRAMVDVTKPGDKVATCKHGDHYLLIRAKKREAAAA